MNRQRKVKKVSARASALSMAGDIQPIGGSALGLPPSQPLAMAKRVLLIMCLWFVFSQNSLCVAAVAESQTFSSVLTNFPPIAHLVLEASYYSPEMSLVEFRYQPGAFYARQLSDAAPSDLFQSRKSTSCGYWNDDFWFIQPAKANHMPPVLWTGVEKRPGKLQRVNGVFELVFSLFASFGITPEGVNSVRIEGQQVIAVMNQGDPRMEYTHTTSLVLSNGLPVSGRIQPNIPGPVKAHPYNLLYVYDSNTAPLPFPKEVICTVRAPKPGLPKDVDLERYGEEKVVWHLIVRELEVGERTSRLPAQMFTPDASLLGSNYQHIVLTNGRPFILKGNNLIPMAALQDKLSSSPSVSRKTRLTFLFFFLISVCILIVVVQTALRKGQNDTIR